MLNVSNQRKFLLWSLIGFFQFTTHGLEPANPEKPSSLPGSSSDSRLEVRTRFPQYRVYYNPSQTAQEALNEKKMSDTKNKDSKE